MPKTMGFSNKSVQRDSKLAEILGGDAWMRTGISFLHVQCGPGLVIPQ